MHLRFALLKCGRPFRIPATTWIPFSEMVSRRITIPSLFADRSDWDAVYSLPNGYSHRPMSTLRRKILREDLCCGALAKLCSSSQ